MPARKPEECDSLLLEALTRGDLETAVALYEPNATLVPSPGQPVTGTAAIREAIKGFVAMKPQIDMKVEQTLRASDDLAICYGAWTMKTGDQEMKGKSAEVVRRQPDGTWLFAIDDPYCRGMEAGA